MKTVVCVKRVPDTEARLKIAADGVSVDPAGIKFVLNPYDEFAVEAALKHRETAGGGEVTAITVGPAESAEALRTALAMGADKGLLLRSAPGLEGLAVAQALAAEMKEIDFDLGLFGVKAIDDDLQAVGAMVAEILELPSATSVTEFTVQSGSVTALRATEGGVEVIDLKMPCILTVTKGAYEPRRPSLKGLMDAKKKPVEEKEAAAGSAGSRETGLAYPPERKAGRIVGQGVDAVPELIRLLREEARVL